MRYFLPEVETYTITVSCYNSWEDDSSWLYDSGSAYPAEPEPAPPAPAPVEEPKKSCEQMILDVVAVGDACKLIEYSAANSLVEACPDVLFNAGIEIPITIPGRKDPILVFTFGGTHNTNCEARRTFDLSYKIAACDSFVSRSKAAIGPCPN